MRKIHHRNQNMSLQKHPRREKNSCSMKKAKYEMEKTKYESYAALGKTIENFAKGILYILLSIIIAGSSFYALYHLGFERTMQFIISVILHNE